MIILIDNSTKEISPKKIYIKENQEALLKETITDIIYHFTSIFNAYEIVQTDTIYLQTPLGSNSEYMGTKQLFFLSTTRQRSTEFGYSQKYKNNGVRITLDGTILGNSFKGKAINYWGKEMGKHSYYRGKKDFLTKQHHSDNESEDRIFFYSPKLENAHRYIKRIDVIISPNNEKQIITAYNMLMSKFSNMIFVYENTKDFNEQNKNIINDKVFELGRNTNNLQLKNNTYNNQLSQHDLAKIVTLILTGEVNDKKFNQEASILLRKYGLEKYISGNLFRYTDYFTIENLASDVESILHNYSKNPSEEKSKVLAMLGDYFKKHHFKRYRDLVKYKIDLGLNTNYQDADLYDINKVIETYVLNKNSYTRYILGDISKVPFKIVMNDAKRFAENLEMYARDRYKTNNDFHFIQYIMSLINKNASIKTMIDIMKKLNLSDEEIEQLMDYQTITLDKISIYDDYKYRFLDEPENVDVYRDIKHKRRFMSLFKKQ